MDTTAAPDSAFSPAGSRRRKRIVFVTRAFSYGGAEKHPADLIDRLDPSMFDAVVLTMGLDLHTALLGQGRGPRVQIAPGPRTGHFVKSWPVFRSLRPEAIVFVDNEFQAFHWQMYLAARFSGARRVVAIECLIASAPEPRKDRGLAARLAGFLRRRVTTRLPGLVCHATICVSDAVRDRLVREYGYPMKKTITLRNGVDLRYFARDAGVWPTPQILASKKGGPVAVCVAALVPSKRIDLLVSAMKKVVARFPESRCVIVGSGFLEEQLRSLVRELGIANNLLFAGQAKDVRPYLAAADVFVLPSEREGLPRSVLEAMAFGLPCVATDAGGNREVIRDGISGFVVAQGSDQALADAIAGLFGDPEERARMGKNARRIVEEEFDIEESMASRKSVILGGT